MAYTTTKLITNSYYISGVIGRELQTITGQQLSDGLDSLNDLLSIKSAATRLIPYFKQYNLNAIIGQEAYFIENLIDIETVTFNIGTVRYSMLQLDRNRYFGEGRVDNINSLPFNWHFERGKGGGTLYIYFKPEQAYPLQIWGKFGLFDADLGEDLSLIYDGFYITYLKYALAEYICNDYAIPMSEQAYRKLKEYEETITDISPIDFTLKKLSTLQSDSGYNWADVNIGRGWTSK